MKIGDRIYKKKKDEFPFNFDIGSEFIILDIQDFGRIAIIYSIEQDLKVEGTVGWIKDSFMKLFLVIEL